MISKEELSVAYKRFDNNQIVRLAKYESKELRADAVEILKSEIINRSLDKTLLEWIDLERNFYLGEELEFLKCKVKNSVCDSCRRKSEVVGIKVYTLSALDIQNEYNLIICKSCGKKLKRKLYIEAITLAWISFNILRIPIYFINEIFAFFFKEKNSRKIIEDFIFQNTGMIRKKGKDGLESIISQYNLSQRNK